MNPHLIAQLDMTEIKAQLPIAYVMHTRGHSIQDDSGGSLSYHSPFRHDEHPSLDVFKQSIAGRPAEDRYGDRTEGTNGDLYDLIMRFDNCQLPEAVETARGYLRAMYQEGWVQPEIEERVKIPLDIDRITRLTEESVHPGFSPLWIDLVKEKPGLDGDLDERYCAYHPHLNRLIWFLRDLDGELVTLRYRNPDGTKFAEKGRPNCAIRFMPPNRELPVLFTEGETDTAAATMHLRDTFEVVGQPGNDFTPDNFGTEMQGRTVYIAFDPDASGRRASKTWANYFTDQGCNVFIITIAEGRDIASMEPAQIAKLKSSGQKQGVYPDGFQAGTDCYYVTMNQGKANESLKQLSNFVFEPLKRLDGDDGRTAWEVRVATQPDPITLPIEALAHVGAFSSWGDKYSLVWHSDNKHLQLLKSWMFYEAAFLPSGKVANQVGLHDGTFVWDGGKVGDSTYSFAPSGTEDHGADRIFIRQATVNRRAVFEGLLASQHEAITGPMLAWLAASPLRTRYRQFPTLAVTGVSGTGKTALTATLLRHFTGTQIATNLSSSTPFAIESIIDSSNAFPVWVDEYRPGARRDTKGKFDQLLRDAYTRQVSVKGNVVGNSLVREQVRTDAPIIVSGEESFQERSHLERMVSVRLMRDEKGPLPTEDATGFAHAYLTFLQQRSQFDAIEPPVYQTFPDSQLIDAYGPRESHNIAVLRHGWALLEEFLGQGYNMPDLNLDRVGMSYLDEQGDSPVVQLILAVMEDERSRDACIYERENSIYISPANLAKIAKDYPVILPTETSKGLRATLMDELGGIDVGQMSWPGMSGSRRVRSIEIKPSALGRQRQETNNADAE